MFKVDTESAIGWIVEDGTKDKLTRSPTGRLLFVLAEQNYSLVGIQIAHSLQHAIFDSQVQEMLAEITKIEYSAAFSARAQVILPFDTRGTVEDRPFQVLQSLSDLRILTLSKVTIKSDGIELGYKGARLLSQGDWPDLEELSLADCWICNEGVLSLVRANWPYLTTLQLYANTFGK